VDSRKRNYPSHETVECKQQRDEARVERGEVLETRNKFGKFKMASIKQTSKGEFQVGDATKETPDLDMPRDKVDRQKDQYVEGTTALIERLLADEIRHERNVLLQCIRHIRNRRHVFDISDKKSDDKDTGS